MAERVLVGRYRLGGVVGVGGVARVYRGTDLRLGRAVAVKVLRADADEEQVRRFEAEVRILAALDHPGLVPIHDSGVHEGHPFLVLRLVEGTTLRREIQNGPLPVERVRALGTGLATALAHVHGNGVVHRDVKPSNILLDERGGALLADFGLARVIDSPRLTSSDRMTGTAAYLAPEQVTGARVGYPADVYALGLVLLECLTGTREYEGGGVETALARLHRPPRVPRDLPPDLVRLLLLMTALPARRRPSAADCARLLAIAPPAEPAPARRRWIPLLPARQRLDAAERARLPAVESLIEPAPERQRWRSLLPARRSPGAAERARLPALEPLVEPVPARRRILLLPARRRPAAAERARLAAVESLVEPVPPRRRWWIPVVGTSGVLVAAAVCWGTAAPTGTLRPPAATAPPPVSPPRPVPAVLPVQVTTTRLPPAPPSAKPPAPKATAATPAPPAPPTRADKANKRAKRKDG
ncbi:hypothetical protein JOD54_004088 [Actinokineospora baliensis]|uniref:serine/threonine-protein kinase n=1 Tax=Actinokineospora baliensis TaxID=547056 RepID=UPI00195877B3|nr:serine/threonine-protein kinase [Actinokineospora baliensis]MBM7773884.1 hypothetical protein [Actinokineospora baliensis]